MSTNAEGVSWLVPWIDVGLAIPDGLEKDALIGIEKVRIARALSVVLYASSIPRRLGGEASSEDLALDKRRCRRVAYALRQSYRGWDKEGEIAVAAEDSVKQEGAQLLWDDFGERHLTEIRSRGCLVVTWAVKSGDRRWGKTAATNFTNELRWLSYALR